MGIHWLDALLIGLYLCGMVAVGIYFLRRNKSNDDYYVGSRGMKPGHVGLSVVATDVGGGFSIGLGGLGFAMGLSGSWMLFTGLVGAWLSAVFLIPRVYGLSNKHSFLTFPHFLKHHYGAQLAFWAALISLIGYIGFTSSQILAGAKLASATFPELSLQQGVLLMGIFAVAYTVMGGIKAVIYTDTIQWALLMGGLVFVGLPVSYYYVGGWEAIQTTLRPEMLRLDHISGKQLLNWGATIIPIWFIGMTLYQRIYACRDQASARKAWFIAGLFEWPVMAFMGVGLGLLARVAADQGLFQDLGYAGIETMDPELGLPLLLRQSLPVGLMGLMLAAYFSAIMSTADSCLMAASGLFVSDLGHKWLGGKPHKHVRISQWATLAIGAASVFLALNMRNVLDLMLYSYAFMVSGLLIPVLALLIYKKVQTRAALGSLVTGGVVTLTLQVLEIPLPWGLDPVLYGLTAGALVFLVLKKK